MYKYLVAVSFIFTSMLYASEESLRSQIDSLRSEVAESLRIVKQLPHDIEMTRDSEARILLGVEMKMRLDAIDKKNKKIQELESALSKIQEEE